MNTRQHYQLLWAGKETVDEILELIESSVSIEVQLPLEFHHALFHAIHPEADDMSPEFIDESDGPELLDAVASIRGLEELKKLSSPLDRVLRVEVTLTGSAKLTIDVTR